MTATATSWDALLEITHKACTQHAKNPDVAEAVKNALKDNPVFEATRQQLWEYGLMGLINDVRCRHRSASKGSLVRVHAGEAPYAQPTAVGPSARATVHASIAKSCLQGFWGMTFYGKKLFNMTCDDIDATIRRMESNVLGGAAIVNALYKLRGKLKPGQKVKQAWKKEEVNEVYVVAGEHAQDSVKQEMKSCK
jgi:hypothetical protein